MNSGDGDLSPSQRTIVLRALKRSSGLSVQELAARLQMSYMGVKQHCINLEKQGLLKSRNQHRGAGRPVLLYRLSRRGQNLFSRHDNALLLSILKQATALYGASAGAKLVFLSFQEKTARYLEKMPREASLDEKMAVLAGLREDEGCMSHAEAGAIIEYHSPWRDLFEAYPEAASMEEALFSKVLGVPFVRRVIESGDQYEIRFEAFRCEPAVN